MLVELNQKKQTAYPITLLQGGKEMKYFAAFLTMKDEEKNKIHRPAHLEFLEEMRKQKKVLMNGRFLDGAGGLIIYVGDSLEQVEGWVQEDPYIALGARNYTLHEWEMVTDVKFVE